MLCNEWEPSISGIPAAAIIISDVRLQSDYVSKITLSVNLTRVLISDYRFKGYPARAPAIPSQVVGLLGHSRHMRKKYYYQVAKSRF
jgi:hypothetical protein